MDYLAVPINWHADVLKNNGIPADKIIILRAGLNPTYLESSRETARKQKFLFVGKYEKRKCVEEMLECFADTIKPGEGTLTVLIADPHNPSFEVKRLPIIGKCENIIPAIPPTSIENMIGLYGSHEYILVPSRAGGIELPLLEGMSQGCVPIVTQASGMQHYVPKDWDWFIPVKEEIPMYDNRWFPPSINWGTWAEPDWDVFKQLLLRASKLKPTAESELVKLHVQRNLSYSMIVQDLLHRITSYVAHKR